MKDNILVTYCTNRDLTFQKKFNKEIKQSIGCDHFVAPFDNDGSWSLTEAYNHIWEANEADNTNLANTIFVFMHHDIHFKSRGWGKNLLNIFNNNEVDILGLAGTEVLNSHGVWWLNETGSFNENDLWGKVWHTDGKKEWKSDFTRTKKCGKVQPVTVIDGVFMAVNPETCFKFDEDFDGFHYYDVSFCLDNHVFGKNIAVTETIQIIHESGGKPDEKWEANRKKLIDIYENHLPLNLHK